MFTPEKERKLYVHYTLIKKKNPTFNKEVSKKPKALEEVTHDQGKSQFLWNIPEQRWGWAASDFSQEGV